MRRMGFYQDYTQEMEKKTMEATILGLNLHEGS